MHSLGEHIRADETNSKRKHLRQEGKIPAQEISSTGVKRATRERGLRATMVRLLLITLFGGFCMLAYGHTTVHSDALPAAKLVAQVDSLGSAQQPTPTPDWVREFEFLKIRVESELGASEKGIAALQEANDRSFYFDNGTLRWCICVGLERRFLVLQPTCT